MNFRQKKAVERRMTRQFLMGVAVISLSACQTLGKLGPDATVVDAKAEVPIPSTWVEPASDALPNSDWVGEFQSAKLTELVDTALLKNPTIGRNIAQLDQALSRIRVSRSNLFPTVNGGASSTISRGGIGFNAGSESYDLGLNASWEADLFGRVRDQIDADEVGAAASSADVAATRLSIAGQVAQGWFNIIQANQLVALSESDISSLSRAFRLTQRRFESGITGSSDVRLAKSSVANAEALLALRLQNRDVLIRSLKALLRDYPDANMLVPENFPALPALSGVGSPGDVLQRRPDVIAAERRIAQSGLNVDIARKALYPSLNLSGGLSETVINRQGSTTGFDLGDLFDLQDVAKRLTAQLTAPLFQGGRLRGQIEGQEAALRGQVEAYVETVLRAYQEVENALDGEGRLLEREAALRISLEEAQKAEERLETRYIEGLATILQLLDAQSRRLSAEAQLVNVKAERLNNRVRLYVALGGGTYGTEASTQQLAQLAN